MDTLHKAMDRWVDELPRRLLADLLDEKLTEQGVKLSKEERERLADGILKQKANPIEIDDGQKRRRNLIVEFTAADSERVEKTLNGFIDALSGSIVDDLTERTSQSVLKALKRKWPKEFRAQRRDLTGFRRRLHDRWGEGLEKLRMLITIAREYGSDLNDTVRGAGGGASPRAFDVLARLHARSCQVAEEIVCLLGNGFADGAMARWRTLHEIAAVAWLIERNGEELAERYRLHEIVESRKAARQYQKYQERLGQEPIADEQMIEIEARYASILQRYGPEFANRHGWAAGFVGKRNLNPSIADIQEAAGFDHPAPYYRMASHNVHANPRGVFLKLGLIGETDVLLAGPSNAGMADPGHATALSLLQICGVLLRFDPTIDNVIAVKVMWILAGEIGDALLAAHKELEYEERSLGGGTGNQTAF